MKRLLLVALLVSCKSAPPPANVGVSSKDDRCRDIPHGCPGTEDDDGCPDTMFTFGDGCSFDERTSQAITRAAQEMMNEPDLTRLVIISPTPHCADAVGARFVEVGVPANRLDTRTDPAATTVILAVGAWKGRLCK